MHFSRLTVFHSSLTAIVLVIMSSTCRSAERLQVNGETMGTYFSVTIDHAPDSDTEDTVRNEIASRLGEINDQMSTWESESEISRFNRSNSTDWFPVSAEFAVVVREAIRIHELSNGAFDPTLSPLIDLWGFGKSGRSGVPDQTAIDTAMQSVGMQHINVRMDPPALRKTNAAVQLNLSAIAKGYAVDAIAELLARSGRPSFIVDIGGETRAGIAKQSGDPWRIGVESPNSGLSRNEQPTQIVPITEYSIATSGDYRNYFEVDGVTYSHTIDPGTGRPVNNPAASVSVIHKSCMTADAFATTLMVLGYERGIELANELGYSVLIQTAGPGGEIAQHGTGVFATKPAEEHKASESWVVFVAAGALFLVAVGGMAIGVLINKRQLKGSCGGLASMPGGDMKSICDLCSIPREECVNEDLRQQMQATDSDCKEQESWPERSLTSQSERRK